MKASGLNMDESRKDEINEKDNDRKKSMFNINFLKL